MWRTKEIFRLPIYRGHHKSMSLLTVSFSFSAVNFNLKSYFILGLCVIQIQEWLSNVKRCKGENVDLVEYCVAMSKVASLSWSDPKWTRILLFFSVCSLRSLPLLPLSYLTSSILSRRHVVCLFLIFGVGRHYLCRDNRCRREIERSPSTHQIIETQLLLCSPTRKGNAPLNPKKK